MDKATAIKKIEYGLEMETSEPTPFGQLTVVSTDALRVALSALLEPVNSNEVQQESIKTNADRIRAMTDEELAWELMVWRCEAVAKHHGVSSEYPDTQSTILQWLQQPAKEG